MAVVVGQGNTRKRRTEVKNKALATKSHIWLLRAKKWTNDTRDIEGTDSLQVYLLPDREVTIGKNRKMCDVVVPGDKTVSGKHATVCVKVEHGDSHVLVRDCSRLGTVVTKTNDFKTGRFVGESVVAHDSWYVLFGHMSPFQVKQVDLCVRFNEAKAEEEGLCVAHKAGIPVLEELSGGAKGIHLVVGRDSCHPVDEKILLSALLGIPVVRLGWLEAWAQKLWIKEGPRQKDYGVTLVHEGKTLAEPVVTQNATMVYRCKFLDSSTAEKAEIMSCSFVWPWGNLSRELHEAMGILGIQVVETSLSECSLVCEGLEKPVVIVKDAGVASDLPNSAVFFCFLSDLMALVFHGEVRGLLRPLSEIIGENGAQQHTAADADGWHTVYRHSARESPEQQRMGNHISDNGSNFFTAQATGGRTRFVKKYVPKSSIVIPVGIQGEVQQEAAAAEEWAEEERQRMVNRVKDDAFANTQGISKKRRAMRLKSGSGNS